MAEEQNIVETQLILGKQVLEIVFDLLKSDSRNKGSLAFKHKWSGFYYHSREVGRQKNDSGRPIY